MNSNAIGAYLKYKIEFSDESVRERRKTSNDKYRVSAAIDLLIEKNILSKEEVRKRSIELEEYFEDQKVKEFL